MKFKKKLNRETIVIEDFDDNLTIAKCASNQEVLNKTQYNCEMDYVIYKISIFFVLLSLSLKVNLFNHRFTL